MKQYYAHSSGIYCWYFPGGYRCDESSDYGIINPDGSDRPATVVLREYAEKFKTLGDLPTLDILIPIDRDDSSRGPIGIYYTISPQLLKAFREGKNVGLINRAEDGGKILFADDLSSVALAVRTGAFPLRYVTQ